MSNFATSTSAKDCELEEVTSILSYYEDSARRKRNSNDVAGGDEMVCMDGIHDEGKYEDVIGLVSKNRDLVESSAVTGAEKQRWGCGMVLCLG